MKIKTLLLLMVACATCYGGTVTGTLQGPSGLPVKNATLTFTLQQPGLQIGSGNIAQLSAQCFTSTDGTVVGLPNPLATPIVAASTSGGTLPAGIYYVTETFFNGSGGESLPSPELQIQLSSTGQLVISLPTTVPTAAIGVRVYMSTSRATETLQGTFSSGTYSQNIPLVSGPNQPLINSSVCSIAFNDTIIPYSGYNVSLISSSGNAYPGWPQAWQLNGGISGTINVAQGAPLWNGTVIYPAPLLQQPLNHGQQSVSGPVDFSGYDVTNIGDLTAGQVNSVINANLQPGGDIGAKVNNSFAQCANQCTVYIPAGSYSFSTTINLPMALLGNYKLDCDSAATMTYTGTGDAILATPTSTPTVTDLTISGCRLLGSNLANGIHVMASDHINIDHNMVTGFSNGLLLEGPNTVNVDHNFFGLNTNGVMLLPTFCTLNVCGPTPASGAAFTTNRISINNNYLAENSGWGVIDANAQPSNTGSLNNVIAENNFELNGAGAIYIYRGTGYHITGNYFETSPRQIVLGTVPLGSPYYFAATQTTIDSNHFTEETGTPYSIELINATYTRIENNDTIDVTMGSSNCFLNVGAGSTAENHTLFGQNQVVLTGGGNLLCQAGSVIQNFVGAGSYATFNDNYKLRLVFQAFPITAAASDVVPAQFVVQPGATGGSACLVFSSNNGSQATAQSLIASTYIQVGPAAQEVTFYHPTGHAGLLYDIWCSGPPN